MKVVQIIEIDRFPAQKTYVDMEVNVPAQRIRWYQNRSLAKQEGIL